MFKANSVVTYQTVEIPRFKCDQISLATDNNYSRCTNRSVLFLIENQRTKEVSLFFINRVNEIETQKNSKDQLEQILFDLGTANTSESTLKSIPTDFYFLNDIFV